MAKKYKRMDLLTPELKSELNKHVGKNVSTLNKEGGLFKEMSKAMLEYLMNQEMTETLGDSIHQYRGNEIAGNVIINEKGKSVFGE